MTDAIWGFTGVILGAAISVGAQLYLEKRKNDAYKKAVSTAFFGEIYAILNIVFERGYVEELDKIIRIIEKNNYFPSKGSLLSMQFDTYFYVYKNNISNLGLLPSNCACLTTNFYCNLFSIMEDVTMIPHATMEYAKTLGGNESEIQSFYIRTLIQILIQDLRLLVQMIESGRTICAEISKEYKISYNSGILSQVKSYDNFLYDETNDPFISKYREVLRREDQQ